jgi:hypothetical protein
MSGITQFVSSMFPNNVEVRTREADIQNQARTAQAVQMLQEARLKAEMQPYDIESKQADAAWNRDNV